MNVFCSACHRGLDEIEALWRDRFDELRCENCHDILQAFEAIMPESLRA